MKLKLIKNGDIAEYGASRSVKTYMQPGQGIANPDSFTRQNLTGCMYTSPCEIMSFELQRLVYYVPDLTGSEKAVLIALSDTVHSKDREDKCWMLLTNLAKKSSFSVATVKRALISLKNKDLITCRYTGRASTFFVNRKLMVSYQQAHDELQNLDLTKNVCLIDGHTVNCTHKKGIRFEGIRKSRRAKQ